MDGTISLIEHFRSQKFSIFSAQMCAVYRRRFLNIFLFHLWADSRANLLTGSTTVT